MEKTVSTIEELKRWIVYPTQTQEKVSSDLKEVNRKLEALKKVGKKSKFAFENTPEQISQVKGELLAAKLRIDQENTRLLMRSKGYPEELDYAPLSFLKQGAQLPSFFIINIKHNQVKLRFITRYSALTELDLEGENALSTYDYPKSLRDIYLKTVNNFLTTSPDADSYDNVVRATAKYQGIIPDSSRNKINVAQRSRLFNDLYIIAEARSWQFGKEMISRSAPIIVGWVDKTSQMFVIDCFAPTSLDDLLSPS